MGRNKNALATIFSNVDICRLNDNLRYVVSAIQTFKDEDIFNALVALSLSLAFSNI